MCNDVTSLGALFNYPPAQQRRGRCATLRVKEKGI